jgi:hypothetical protein
MVMGKNDESAFEHEPTILRPAEAETSPFAAYLGVLPVFSSREEINVWLRDLRGHDLWDEEDRKEAEQ